MQAVLITVVKIKKKKKSKKERPDQEQPDNGTCQKNPVITKRLVRNRRE